MFSTHRWNTNAPVKKPVAPIKLGKNGKVVPVKKAKTINSDNFTMTRDDLMGLEDENMGFDLMASLKDLNNKYLKAPVQKAIDQNRDKLIASGMKAGVNAVGKVLDKAGATDPKKLKAVQDFTSSITAGAVSGAQASLTEKVKPYIPWIIGGTVALAGTWFYFKRKKSV